MIPFFQVCLIFVFPALLVAMAAIAAGRWHSSRFMTAVMIVSAGAAMGWGLWQINGRPHWPPGAGDALFLLFWFNIVIAVAALALTYTAVPPWMQAVFGLVLLRLACRAVAVPSLHDGDSGLIVSGLEGWIDLASTLALLWWILIDRLLEFLSPTGALALLMVLSGSEGGIQFLTHNLKAAMVCIETLGLCTAVLPAALIGPAIDRKLMRSLAMLLAMPLLGELALDHFLSYTPPQPAIVWAWLAAPLLGAIALLPVFDRTGMRLRSAQVFMLVVLGVGAAVGLSVVQYREISGAKTSPSGEY